MDKAMIDQIRFCSFCPNVCRFYYPTRGISQRESMAPSALAYLGYAVTNGFIEYTDKVAEALSRLEGCEACREACPYNFDIPECLRRLTDEYADKTAK